MRRRRPAGAAPSRPEIKEYRNFAVTNNLIEFPGIHYHGLTSSRTEGWEERNSTLLVWVEDVILCFYCRMARVSAVREACGIGRELVRCGIVVEYRVSPPT